VSSAGSAAPAAGPGPTSEVAGFRHVPGNHCGSTALRNLLVHHGVPISEELAFGLGAGADFFYLPFDDLSPSRFTNGRTGRLEERFLEITGLPLRQRTSEDPGEAWAMAAATIDEGRPAILLTDLYYLDHYGKSAHFPGHAVVLTGYDDDSAYVSDTAFEEIQRTSLEGLKKARHEQHPFFPLAGQMIDLPPGEAVSIDSLKAKAPAAVGAAAKAMHEPQMGEFEGLPALQKFAAEVGEWPDAVADWQWCARFNYQVIEKRGTGGGNFRAMYSRFLAEVGLGIEAEQAAAASGAWSVLAEDLFAASEADEPESKLWDAVRGSAAAVLDAETLLWDTLARA
jgi:hypothetical protein